MGCLKAEIYVYRAELQDLGKAAGLFNQYRQFYKRDDDLSGAEQYIRERLTQGDSVIYLAVSKTADTLVPAGYVQLYPSLSSLSMSRIWILNDLFVDSDYQGMASAENCLIKRKCMLFKPVPRG